MSISIVTNTQAQNAQRNLGRTQFRLAKSLSRLSSGMRINSAADDAAGLAISEKLKSQIRSMHQAERNANDGISLLQVLEGSMGEISGMLTRMRELSVQAGSDTIGAAERTFIQNEISDLRDEIDRIAEVTEFNGTTLIDGTASNLVFQVGVQNTTNDRLTINIDDMHASQIGSGAGSQLSAVDVTSITGAQDALDILDDAISDVSAARARVGAYTNRIQVAIQNLGTARENLSAANSRIRDVDVAGESAELTKQNILMQAGVSVLAQANQAPSIALSLIG